MDSRTTKKQIADGLGKANIYPTKITFFNNSSSQSIYKINTKKETFVLKIFRSSYYDELQKEIALLRKLAPHFNNILLPIHTDPIMINKRPAYVYRFFNGRRFSDIIINRKYFIFGKIVAELDVALQRLPADFKDISNNNLCLVPRRIYQNSRLNNLANQAIKLFDEEIKKINFDKIRKQYIHKDLHFFNVIYNVKNKDYLIIDTNGLSIQYLPREIAVSAGNILVRYPDSIVKKDIKDLLAGYNSLIKLNGKEKESIPLFMIQKKLGEIDYLHGQLGRYQYNTRIIQRYLNLSQKTLEYIVKEYDSLVNFFKQLL